ncbi:zinc-binding alcohol dehydrogenase family protein [Schleiferilactobacillus shenzhenensis]|uniref:Zinc-type alcohol dehydrogenase-like protein n=1 Tax=Schleiferilactobacillus shenzhenensis LY-73 TaxID=1231336 RepID=U4TL24_9LACO|nr:zinc-binding alcohol dehydrogenase family protein [Schleiferilactobacillus shenzhenensis]ERL64884.1 hypothetical protein L248_0488 [Schleiferilactobacillus shenzhenensis LY-73]
MVPKLMHAVAAFQTLPIRDEASLQDVWLPTPQPKPYDVLVKVLAISVNPVDVRLRHAIRGHRRPHVFGYDAVGEVVALGAETRGFAVGDRVFYFGSTRRSGSYAEYQVVDYRLIAKAPQRLTNGQAAAIPMTGVTAWELLFERMGLPAAAGAAQGTIMVVNAAGGVGSILIQLAQWAGLEVIGVASRVNWPWLKKFGIEKLADYHDDLTPQIQALGYDMVDNIVNLYDPLPYFGAVADLIAPMGHVGSIVATTEALPVAWLKNKSVSLDWEYVFSKSDYAYQMATQGQILQRLSALLDAGALRSTIAYKFHGINAHNLRQAQAMLETKNTIGKITLQAPFDGPAVALDDIVWKDPQSYADETLVAFPRRRLGDGVGRPDTDPS